MDFTGMTDDELYELMNSVSAELGRRQSRAMFDAKIADVVREARGGVIPDRGKGEPWEQPSGDVETVYFKGDEVEHKSKTWVSTVDNNVWEPGVSGWRETLEDDPKTGEPQYPEYLQPTGGHDSYEKGDRVMWDGSVYESTIDGNVWSPDDYPAGWTRVDEDDH